MLFFTSLQTFANMQTATMFVKGIPPIIFTLFIGPWSDNFGRKTLMILPLTGYIAYNAWFLINVIFYDKMPADWLMLEVFKYWPGGYMCLFLGLYSYVTDNSSPEYRTTRIAIVDCIVTIGIAVGQGNTLLPRTFPSTVIRHWLLFCYSALSSKVYSSEGYIGIYSFGLVFQCLAILYGVFFIKEKKVSWP